MSQRSYPVRKPSLPAKLPDGRAAETGNCRSCKADVLWAKTPAGKIAPYDYDGRPHFATCPDAQKWKAGRE